MKTVFTNAGSSVLAIARVLTPVLATGVGVAAATPAAAQSLCSPLTAGTILCNPAPVLPPVIDPTLPVLPTLNIPPVAGPVLVTLADGFRSTTTAAVTTLGTGADITLDAIGSAVIDTVDAPGLALNSGGAITGQISSITTAGDGATGALLRAVDGVIFVADDLVSTIGDNAPALDVIGRSVDVDANVLRTAGNNSNAARLLATDGPLTLDADLLETAGDLSNAAVLRGNGTVGLTARAIRTAGTDALAIDVSNDAAACVLLGTGGCDRTITVDEITTGGFGGIGALVTGAGATTINVGVLRTGGDEAAGLNLSADPAACIALGVGACGTAFTVENLTTDGARSIGALVRAGGPISANVGVLRTAGDQAAGLDLATDPDVCAVVGARNCGTSFSVGELTTQGAGAIGALVRATGPTTGNIGLLRTNGDDAAGIDIAANPVACVLLGAGGCDIGLNAADVGTRGNGAAGVLLRPVGRLTAQIGRITTLGNGSTGLGILADPTACVVLGPGACTITAVTGPIDTGGDNSPGVDVDGGGDPVDVTTGPVNTGGDNSPGVDVDNDGPTTVTTGPVTTGGDNSPGVTVDGGEGPTVVTTGPVTTTGSDSPAVDVDGIGPIDVSAGPINTTGPNSPGIDVDGGDGPISVEFTDVTTRGPDSPGVDVTGNGPITVDGGNVTTGGDRSDGVTVDGGTGPVRVDVDTIRTGGAGSDGIVVTTDSGDQTIIAGPITVTGPGANGIVATSPGCSTIDITARGAISAAQGTGILASSACAVRVTTLAGAPVSGSVAGIDVTSGTGSTITIGDAVSSASGPAINANGAASTVTIAPTGIVTGFVDLTDGNDVLTNAGTFEAVGNSSFGGGTDRFVNTGRFAVRPRATTAGAVTLGGLEAFANSGTIDMRNGVTGDSLAIPGSFTGSGASTLGLDISIAAAGSTADRLIVGGAATGTTAINAAVLRVEPGVLVNNLVLVDAGAGSTAGAFTLDTSGLPRSLVDFTLAFDAGTNDYALFGTPNTSAYEIGQLTFGAQQLFYRTNDTVSGHLQSLRDGRGDGMAANGDERPRRSSALWGQLSGSATRADRRTATSVFGQTNSVTLDHTQDFFGAQIGLDFGAVDGRGGAVFGVTGGYASSVLAFRGNADRLRYQAVNAGAYAAFDAGAFFLNGLARYEHYFINAVVPTAGVRQKLDGDGYGAMAQAGLRLGTGNWFVEPAVSVEYVRTDIGQLSAASSTLSFDGTDGVRGKAGARVGTRWTTGNLNGAFYAGGQYVHAFRDEARTGFASGAQSVTLGRDRLVDYGRATIGFDVNVGGRVNGFVEGFGDVGKGYRGGGGRAGLSIRF